MTSNVAIILLAAGQSSRMRGADKLLEEIDGTPLLERQARICLASKATTTLVVIGENQTQREEIAARIGIDTVIAKDAALGMSASLKTGISALSKEIDAALILPADMPEITTSDLNKLIGTYRKVGAKIVRAASADQKPGHPVLFRKDYFTEINALTGDQGARPILQKHAEAVHLVTLDGNRAHLDLDTPEEWARWRNAHQNEAN